MKRRKMSKIINVVIVGIMILSALIYILNCKPEETITTSKALEEIENAEMSVFRTSSEYLEGENYWYLESNNKIILERIIGNLKSKRKG